MHKPVRFSFIFLCAAFVMFAATTAMAQSQGQSGQNGQGNNDVKVTTYKDWKVRCLKSRQDVPCEMTQLINGPKSDKPVMRVVMSYATKNKKPAMAFQVPLGTALVPGVALKIDGEEIGRAHFQVCLKQGCRAVAPLKDDILGKLKNGRNANVEIVGPNGKPIDLDISLMGFTAANNAIAP